MIKRILTAIILLPLFFFLIISGGTVLRIATLIVSVIGMNEIYVSLSGGNKKIHIIGYIFCVFYMLLLDDSFHRGLYIITSVFILTLLVYLVIAHNEINIIDCLITMFGFYYIAFLLSNVYFVREYPEYGKFFVWLIFISAWMSDTGAYFVGINLGKHKLIPSLSPKKTVEGMVGGILTAVLSSVVFGLLVRYIFKPDIDLIFIFACASAVGAVLAQLGDLSASAIKRHTGIKDFGKIFPGHGGVTDRFDSVLFTAPAVYLATRLLFYFL